MRVPLGILAQELTTPGSILPEALAAWEVAPGSIFLGACGSREHAPRSCVLQGQSATETLAPWRTLLGELRSYELTAPASSLLSDYILARGLR